MLYYKLGWCYLSIATQCRTDNSTEVQACIKSPQVSLFHTTSRFSAHVTAFSHQNLLCDARDLCLCGHVFCLCFPSIFGCWFPEGKTFDTPFLRFINEIKLQQTYLLQGQTACNKSIRYFKFWRILLCTKINIRYWKLPASRNWVFPAPMLNQWSCILFSRK